MACAVVLQACGDDAAPRGPEPKVRLQVTVPQDGATVRAETEANGPIVARVRNSFLRPTSYSSVQ